MKNEYVICLTKRIGTNTYDTFTLLRTSSFEQYRSMRVAQVHLITTHGLFDSLEINTKIVEVNGEQVTIQTLYITIK